VGDAQEFVWSPVGPSIAAGEVALAELPWSDVVDEVEAACCEMLREMIRFDA
jgi:hypothetical protein